MMHARCACSRTPGPCMNLCASVSLFQDPFHGFGNAHLLAPNTLLLVCEEPNSSITRNALRRCPRMARANIHQKAPSFLTKLRYALVYAKAYLCRGNAAPFLLRNFFLPRPVTFCRHATHKPCKEDEENKQKKLCALCPIPQPPCVVRTRRSKSNNFAKATFLASGK